MSAVRLTHPFPRCLWPSLNVDRLKSTGRFLGMETTVKRSRRTKIIATLGPASDTPEMIETLFRAGADVFRLNMSHLPREKLPEKIEALKQVIVLLMQGERYPGILMVRFMLI